MKSPIIAEVRIGNSLYRKSSDQIDKEIIRLGQGRDCDITEGG